MNHYSAIAAQYSSLYDTDKFADFKIIVSHESRSAEFNAHRTVLSAVPYFDRLFLSDFSHSKPKDGDQFVRVQLEELHPANVKLFLDCLYLGISAVPATLTNLHQPTTP